MSIVAALILGYMVGAMPTGYLLIRLVKKQDITKVGSGRTGGTNAMRAGGLAIGVLTGVMDLAKGYLVVLLSEWLVPRAVPHAVWIHILTGALGVLGHNWSIWLYLFTKRFNAGAGGAPTVGAAMAFWPGIILVCVPIALVVLFIIGYASIATISAAMLITILFAIRAAYYGQPWQYIFYGVLALILVCWALRPNIQRLINGTERRIGIFARK